MRSIVLFLQLSAFVTTALLSAPAALAEDTKLLARLEARIAELEARLAGEEGAEARLNALEARLVCLSFDEERRLLAVDGCNLHVRDGSGSTLSSTGLGNLVVGYDEGEGAKYGTHNVVIGPEHSYSGVGALVAGIGNRAAADHVTVAGGSGVTVNGKGDWAMGSVSESAGNVRVMAVSGDFALVARDISLLGDRNVALATDAFHALVTEFLVAASDTIGLEAARALQIDSGGEVNISGDRSVTATSAQDVNVVSQGDVLIKAAGQVTAKGSKVNVP